MTVGQFIDFLIQQELSRNFITDYWDKSEIACLLDLRHIFIKNYTLGPRDLTGKHFEKEKKDYE